MEAVKRKSVKRVRSLLGSKTNEKQIRETEVR